MDTEIELKLAVDRDVTDIIEQCLIPSLKVKSTAVDKHLFNQYYDTPQRVLRKFGIGLRVRRSDDSIEQTIKTRGKVSGGLHQRPEYNVPLSSMEPDLDLFDTSIWPENLSLSRLEAQIEPLFRTDFHRRAFELQFDDGSRVELVFDQGHIVSRDHQDSIREVELELKDGQPECLFRVALALAALTPVRLSNLSKAARGYMLSDNKPLTRRALTDYLDMRQDDNCETAFIKAIEYALSHWQHHEACYLASAKVKDLYGVLDGMRLCLQAITLFLPTLQCQALLDLHKQLIALEARWQWLEDLLALKELRSRKGQFRKKLAPHDGLISYLRGRSEGLVLEHELPDAFFNAEHVGLQLNLMKTLLDKPWQQASENYAVRLKEHARGWLSQGWQSILQAMPKGKVLSAQEYLSHQSTLRQTMYNGLMLGSLFDEGRDQFRAPWLDILEGMEELAVLSFLQKELRRSDLEDSDDLMRWSNDKIVRLLSVMEQSRAVALQLEAYW